MRDWIEDELLPRLDAVVDSLDVDADLLRVEHPDWFRAGDVLRLGRDDLVPSGELDEFAREIMVARNEAAWVLGVVDGRLLLRRAVGANPARPVERGDVVSIVGSATLRHA